MAIILSVDDDDKIRNIIKAVLTNRGHQLVTASSGSEGLKMFHSTGPHITILDLQLPDMNGLSVLQQIRAIDPGGIVIILTGADTTQLEHDARKLGATEVLQKGFSLHTIGDTVNRLLMQAGVISHTPFPGETTNGAMSQPERRKHPRIPVQLYAALSREGVAFGDGEIVDLSLSGCALRTLASIQRGDYLAIQILDPLGRAAQDDCIPFGCDLAVVRWANEPSCGLEFILMAPENKDRLCRYVKTLEDQPRTAAAK